MSDTSDVKREHPNEDDGEHAMEEDEGDGTKEGFVKQIEGCIVPKGGSDNQEESEPIHRCWPKVRSADAPPMR